VRDLSLTKTDHSLGITIDAFVDERGRVMYYNAIGFP
jgi:hypothetical protein